MEPIDKKYLAGLTFKGSKPAKGEEGKVEHRRFERALKPDDVLDWKDKGDTVVIVAADGRKHTVEKKAAKEAAKAGGDAGGEG